MEKSRFIKEKIKFIYINEQKQVLNIAFNINNAYSMQAGVVITSAIINSKDIGFTFHIFMDSVDDKNLRLFDQLAERFCVNIYIYIVNMELFRGFGAEKTRFTAVSLFRLCMTDVLRKITDRFLYLDADVLCLNDLSIFLNIEFDEKIVAAVPDLAKDRLEEWGIKNSTYFNSGVLLISCNTWEKENITEQLFSFRDRLDNKIKYPDQDILNRVLNGKVKYLDKRFNFFGFYGTTLQKDYIIYHFIGREKPWNIAVRDIEKKWRYYLSLTPWPCIEYELPSRVPSNYFYFKNASFYYYKNKRIVEALKCYFLYSWLKMLRSLI